MWILSNLGLDEALLSFFLKIKMLSRCLWRSFDYAWCMMVSFMLIVDWILAKALPNSEMVEIELVSSGDIEYICCFPRQKHNKVFGMLESLEMLELYLDLALKEAFGIHNKVVLMDGGIYNLRSNELSQRYLHLFHSYLGLIRMFYKTLFRYK